MADNGTELQALKEAAEDVQNQIFVDTATDIGLSNYEEMLDLSSTGELSERRDMIKAKIQGFGSVTYLKFKNILRLLLGDEAIFIEDFPSQTILIKGLSDIRRMISLQEEIRKIVPAHLRIFYEWFIWNYLDLLGWTWDEFDALNLTWNELEV